MDDIVTLAGDPLARITQALQVAKHQLRLGQTALPGRHLEDALVDVEQAIADALARIRDAVDDDHADDEETGQADRQRQAWYSPYRAA